MGDPKKPKNKFSRPSHPWQGKRIEDEKKIVNDYGLKNKQEVWRAESFLKKLKKQAKLLIASRTEQGEIEAKQLIERLVKLNLIGKDAKIEDVLDISLESVLDRRLQTQVYKLGLSKTINQARQFIVHRHIAVDGKIVTVPSYRVCHDEEGKIGFWSASNLNDEDHPERIIKKEVKQTTKVENELKEPEENLESEIEEEKILE
ncbi:MAG: 30S ribosomal protein S4 [Nanoarchaeota archaeon]